MTTLTQLRQLHQQAGQRTWHADELITGETAGYESGVFDGERRRAIASPGDAELVAAMRNALPHLLDIAQAADVQATRSAIAILRSHGHAGVADMLDESISRQAEALARLETA